MNLSDAKILVVEDDPLMRTFTVNTLKRIGVTHLQECADGTAALKMALAFHPHLILTDIHMKPMGGWSSWRSCARAKAWAVPKSFS